MRTAFVIVTVLAATSLTFSATVDFVRYEKVLDNMARAGVPETWLTSLGLIKAVGAGGLLVGLAAPVVGIAAAAGVIAFFVGAIVTHVRAGWFSFAFPGAFLMLGVACLGLGIAAS